MLLKNSFKMVKSSLFKFFWVAFIVSFLLFFLNVLLGVSFFAQKNVEDMRDRLGVFIYLKTDVKDSDKLYAQAIALQDQLKQEGLEVDFRSKEKWWEIMAQRFPEVVELSQETGLDIPLPALLFIRFNSKEQYESLNKIVSQHKEIIQDLSWNRSQEDFAQQQSRSERYIEFFNFVVYFAYFMVGVFIFIILSFIILSIKNSFYGFYKQIEVEKLLGALYYQIKVPFWLNSFYMLVLGFALSFGYLYIFVNFLNQHLGSIFSINLYNYINMSNSLLIQWVLAQVLIIFGLGFVVSNIVLNRLIRKL